MNDTLQTQSKQDDPEHIECESELSREVTVNWAESEFFEVWLRLARERQRGSGD